MQTRATKTGNGLQAKAAYSELTQERRGFAPAITPLIIGFLLLLGLILALGLRSAKNGRYSPDAQSPLGIPIWVLMDLRLKVNQLDNEARARHRRGIRSELRHLSKSSSIPPRQEAIHLAVLSPPGEQDAKTGVVQMTVKSYPK